MKTLNAFKRGEVDSLSVVDGECAWTFVSLAEAAKQRGEFAAELALAPNRALRDKLDALRAK